LGNHPEFDPTDEAAERVESDTAESIAYQRRKRVRWFKEWLEAEVPEMGD